MEWEYTTTEQPFIEQLQHQGWEFIEGDLDDPAMTGRDSFAEVIQTGVLRQQLATINLRDGKPWLGDDRISTAVGAITRIAASKLMEANQKGTELLLEGISVEGVEGWDGGRGRTIHFIDWDHPENNRFIVINQYKVQCPPGYDSDKKHIIPDLVLLVNGIPLVVVECKNPAAPEPLAQAIDQLRRYSNQRFESHEVEEKEGNESLFYTNQLLIATSFDQCVAGTIGAQAGHFAPWKTVASSKNPERTEKAVMAELGIERLSEQQRTIAGMLDKTNLLDIIRHFTLYMQAGGQTIKVACRYQQYRGVVKAIERLRTGKTRQEDGEYDRRGGIIWHTQGSGKSLSMVFLVRKLRTDPKLRRFKVVVVTDRKDLQKQLADTAELSGDIVEVAKNTHSVRSTLKRKGPGLVFAMIQKYRDNDADGEDSSANEDELPPLQVAEPPTRYTVKTPQHAYEVLNDDPHILVMVDEAHRTQAGDLHANLMAGLPNCARIGFTGTPIIMGEKKRTHEIFGAFIDKYTITEAENDGATVPVLYEGRTAKGAIKDGASLDEVFEDFFHNHSKEELEAIKKKYATKGNVLEAPLLIAEKARDMLRHYVANILPNGYKAQVVCCSRLATLRYFEAFKQARDELVQQAETLSPEMKALDDEQLCHRSPKIQAIVQAWRYLDTLKAIEFAPVFSGSNNDAPEWKPWTEQRAQEHRIERFKKPLFHDNSKKRDPLAFLIVKSMLLTGFDAPIEGVMYLDRAIREAELLQAIARVNRTGHGKKAGIVVDYYGVAHHLKEALAAYSDDDVEGALRSLKDELPKLKDRYQAAMALLSSQGIDGLDDTEACVQALEPEKLQAEFSVKLKAFLESLDLVLPRPEGLPYTEDAKKLAHIYARARNRYKNTPVLGKDVGAKVRKLIDDHVISLGIDPKVAPIALTDMEFEEHIRQQPSERAKASEMEHAVRSHISKHLDEDPVYFGKLSERLEDILSKMGKQWDQIIAALQQIIDEIVSGSTVHEEGLPDVDEHYLPFYRMLKIAACGHEEPDLVTAATLTDLVTELVDHISSEVKTSSFWQPHRKAMQEELQQHIFEKLMDTALVDFDHVEPLVDKMLDLARANSYKLENI
ncbi:type I restriction endonuclease subunit R [Endozoicomonas atrinae]|uniref:type I restriction endonuclease subunit R n=1 Tax=Endozoicomonas atrinae TaxID=1333660 RepID=UPI0008246D7A|nr:type I restriction endonuclease subunit R [Endozoicomonas atrinae]